MNKLWIAVLVACLGDVATTWYGLEVLGFAEFNPLVASVMVEIGILPGLLFIKLAVIGVTLLAARLASSHEWVIPAGIASVWGLAAILNTVQILLWV